MHFVPLFPKKTAHNKQGITQNKKKASLHLSRVGLVSSILNNLIVIFPLIFVRIHGFLWVQVKE